MLTSAEVASLREVGNAFLPDNATISRPARSGDGAGGSTVAYATVATVAVRVQPAGQQPQELVSGERVQSEAVFILVLPAETDVRPGDRVTVGSTVYDVSDALAPRGYEVVRNVHVVRMR